MQTPGAEAPLTVKFIGPVGELCEEHIRITMEYGEITQNMLLPILVIYCSTTIAPSSKTNDNNNNNNINNDEINIAKISKLMTMMIGIIFLLPLNQMVQISCR